MAYIQKRNNSYRVRYNIFENGKLIKKSKTFSRQKDARDFLIKIENSLRENSYIEPSRITLREYTQKWLEGKKPSIALNTYIGYKKNITHINDNIGDVPLQKLNEMHIETMYVNLNRKFSGTSILYIHRVLSNALKQAVKMRLITVNPCNFVNPPKKEKFIAAFYEPDEVRALLEAFKSSYIYITVLLAVTRGLRRSEILGLTWDDIDFKKKQLSINHNLQWSKDSWSLEKLKTDSSKRIIPLSNFLIHELIEQKNRQKKYMEFLWNNYERTNLVATHDDGRPINPSYLSSLFGRTLEINNLRHVRFHDLRHTAASIMLKDGVELKVISSILGHASISITADLYSHVLTELKNEAVNKIDNAIWVQNGSNSLKF